MRTPTLDPLAEEVYVKQTSEVLASSSDLHEQEDGALRPAWAFARKNARTIVIISVAMLIPLFWHRRIMQCDFASHVYTAWLATLLQKGQAPGLYLAHQWNNALVDRLLTALGPLVGWAAAERIVQGVLLLIFFWGAFALMCAASGRQPWFLLPGLAMIAYGWTFEIGFANYYLSLGFAFWAIALFWRGNGGELLFGLALIPAITMAHLFGLALAVGAGAYVWVRKRLPGFWSFVPLGLAATLIFLLREYIVHRYPVRLGRALPLYLMNGLNGVDQIVLGPNYQNLARVLFLCGVAFFIVDCVERVRRGRNRKSLTEFAIPFELYALSLLGIALLPDEVKMPQYTAWVQFMLMRFSSIGAVFSLCLLGCLKPRRWHLAAFGAIATFFFAMLYQDTGVLSHMQEEADQLVSQLPSGMRVAETIQALPGSRFYFLGRMVDRACVGHCYSYSDYEPATAAFRVRALPGSPINLASLRDVEFMEAGAYVVRQSDLPIYSIYQCGDDRVALCMRQLRAGEYDGPPRANPAP